MKKKSRKTARPSAAADALPNIFDARSIVMRDWISVAEDIAKHMPQEDVSGEDAATNIKQNTTEENFRIVRFYNKTVEATNKLIHLKTPIFDTQEIKDRYARLRERFKEIEKQVNSSLPPDGKKKGVTKKLRRQRKAELRNALLMDTGFESTYYEVFAEAALPGRPETKAFADLLTDHTDELIKYARTRLHIFNDTDESGKFAARIHGAIRFQQRIIAPES